MIITILHNEDKNINKDNIDLILYLKKLLNKKSMKILLIDTLSTKDLFYNLNIEDKKNTKYKVNKNLHILNTTIEMTKENLKKYTNEYDYIIIYSNYNKYILELTDIIFKTNTTTRNIEKYIDKTFFIEENLNLNLNDNYRYTLFDIISKNNIYKNNLQEIIDDKFVINNNVIEVDFNRKEQTQWLLEKK